MNEHSENKQLEKLLSLKKEELEYIFSQFSLKDIERLFNLLNEVETYD